MEGFSLVLPSWTCFFSTLCWFTKVSKDNRVQFRGFYQVLPSFFSRSMDSLSGLPWVSYVSGSVLPSFTEFSFVMWAFSTLIPIFCCFTKVSKYNRVSCRGQLLPSFYRVWWNRRFTMRITSRSEIIIIKKSIDWVRLANLVNFYLLHFLWCRPFSGSSTKKKTHRPPEKLALFWRRRPGLAPPSWRRPAAHHIRSATLSVGTKLRTKPNHKLEKKKLN